MFIRLEEGQSAQGEADKWNRPNPGFFDSVDVPDSVLDPTKKLGLGTTQVTNRGLTPKTGSPRPTPPTRG